MTRVLVIEDEEGLANTLVEILSDEGHDARLARNGRDAVEAIRRERPDVIVLDLMLPQLSGTGVLDMLRAESGEVSRTPVVVISAAARQALGGRSVERFLAKPFRLRELLACVRELGEPRADAEARGEQ